MEPPTPVLDFTFPTADELLISDGFVLPKYTILVGKNNTGKSRVLKSLYSKLQQNQNPFIAYYVSPERFGALQRRSDLEDANFADRLGKDRQKLNNQSSEFITDAVSTFNGLIAQLNRSPVQSAATLALFLEHLNGKVPNLVFSYTDSTEQTPFHFKINNKYPDPATDKFSSGTNQIIALMTSVMYFLHSHKYTDDAVLLLDEPDVHIHPDLQFQFIQFMISVTKDTAHKIIIATHSSSILSGFAGVSGACIATKKSNSLLFSPIDGYMEKLLPSVGSHSLSHAFNKTPLLLVEGDDDELVWQHAIRNAGGTINFHIVVTESKDEMRKYEKLVNDVAGELFDTPTAYEIRDSDNVDEELVDEGFVVRSRLNCHEVENLILSDEVLAMLGTDYTTALASLTATFTNCRLGNQGHKIGCPICGVVAQLVGGNFDRYTADLKGSENTIISILKPDNRLPWELLVGKSIGKNLPQKSTKLLLEGSIYHMLGSKITGWLE